MFPDYGGYSIAGIAELVRALYGLDYSATELTQLANGFDNYERIVLLVLDGLGYRRFQTLAKRVPQSMLCRLAARGKLLPLTSVYPCTTTTALCSLSTGMPPAEHGMIGYRLYLRETGTVTNMIRFSVLGNDRPEAAFAMGLDPAGLLPGPTLHQQLTSAGIITHSVLASYIAHSGLSKALYQGSGSIHSALTFSDMLAQTRQVLEQSDGPTFMSLYWSTLDSIGHVRGPHTETYDAEFSVINEAIEQAWEGRLKDTLLLVTADHGFVPMQADEYLDPNSLFDAKNRLVRLPVGEPRASYLFSQESERQGIKDTFDNDRADGLICVTAQEMLESELLGSGAIHPELQARMGDLAVLSTGNAGLYHDYPDGARLRGMHGGLTEDEMLVPFIMAPY